MGQSLQRFQTSQWLRFIVISLSYNLKEKTSVMDLIKGKSLIKADGSSQSAESALAGKEIIMFYFSAHWCPPCRGFTPMLKDFYEESHGDWYGVEHGSDLVQQ